MPLEAVPNKARCHFAGLNSPLQIVLDPQQLLATIYKKAVHVED